MLILTRKKKESVVISGGIKVTVVEIRGEKVRLGIEAPDEVEIQREEVQRQIDAGAVSRRKLKREQRECKPLPGRQFGRTR